MKNFTKFISIKKFILLSLASMTIGATLTINAVDSSAMSSITNRIWGGESLADCIERGLNDYQNR